MKFVICFMFFVLLDGISADCNVAPKYWCDTKEIADACGVLEACSNRLWEARNAEPVKISLFFESLCPGCRQFITTQLHSTWKALQSTGIMEVTMIPYGNAHETEITSGHWNYTCQHGAEECTGNLIENCIKKYTKDIFDEYFPIFYCMEVSKDPIAAAEKCVTTRKADWNVINKCANGKEGNSLMHEAALQTGALEPPHKYVPWILVNGKHTEGMQQEAQTDLLKVVCETYTGSKPEECKSSDIYQSVSFNKD